MFMRGKNLIMITISASDVIASTLLQTRIMSSGDGFIWINLQILMPIMSLALRALDIIGIKIFRLIQINPSPSDIILVCKSVIGNNVGSWDSYPYINFFDLSSCLIIIVTFPSLLEEENILLVTIQSHMQRCYYY